MYLVKKTTMSKMQMLLTTKTMASPEAGPLLEKSQSQPTCRTTLAAAGADQAPESRIRVIASNSHEAKERRKKRGLKKRRPAGSAALSEIRYDGLTSRPLTSDIYAFFLFQAISEVDRTSHQKAALSETGPRYLPRTVCQH